MQIFGKRVKHYIAADVSRSDGRDFAIKCNPLFCNEVRAAEFRERRFEVGRDIHARAAGGNPYQAWIDTYAGEDFHAAVRAVIAATDEAAASASPALHARMHAAFTRATQLEWMFWDSAYRLEAWPL